MMTAPINQNMFYSQSQLETIKSGTTLEMTPLIGDNNDITIELAVEVSDSIPQGRGSDLPVVTRRTAQNSVVIRDGGTVAVAGLTENRTRDKNKRVPFFSELPLVGLFGCMKRISDTRNRRIRRAHRAGTAGSSGSLGWVRAAIMSPAIRVPKELRTPSALVNKEIGMVARARRTNGGEYRTCAG
jgi:hypothetical protein